MQNLPIKKLQDILSNSIQFKGENLSITPLTNHYGVNTNVFKIETEDKSYFAKITNKQQDSKAQAIVEKYLPVPHKYDIIKVNNDDIEIYDFIKGELLTDIFKNRTITELQILENRKNQILRTLYENTQTSKNYRDILQSPASTLYYKRLFGERFKKYYHTIKFWPLLYKTLIINGKDYGTIKTIVDDIIDKYKALDFNKPIATFTGHGDAHHQNIILTEALKFYFIDQEYNSTVTANMEIAKPYYIDFLGTNFYFFSEDLLSIFNIEKFHIGYKSISLDIAIKNLPQQEIKMAEDKMNTFKKLLENCNDPISFNDYLLINHILTRNPALYSRPILAIFLGLIPALKTFDAKDPASLFSFFIN